MAEEQDKVAVEIAHPPPPIEIDDGKDQHQALLEEADEAFKEAKRNLAIGHSRLQQAMARYEERSHDPRL